jgi:hypothetical protein
MARPRTSHDGTRLDDKNLEPFLTASASTVRNTNTTFSDKCPFPNEPTSKHATSTSTTKREEKERPRQSDRWQELDSGQELDGKQELDGGHELDRW